MYWECGLSAWIGTRSRFPYLTLVPTGISSLALITRYWVDADEKRPKRRDDKQRNKKTDKLTKAIAKS